MTHEEMEKATEFILKQQAQFVVEMQQIREVQAGFQTHLGKLTDATVTVVGLVGKVAEAQVKTEERLQALEKSLQTHAQTTEARFQTLADQLSETDGRLNALINIVERYIVSRDGKDQ